MRYMASVTTANLDRRCLNVEAVRDVYVRMIYDTPLKKNIVVVTEVAKEVVHRPDRDYSVPNWSFHHYDDFSREETERAVFPVEKFDEALDEFNRQMNFVIDMYSQSGRKVFANRSRLVRKTD